MISWSWWYCFLEQFFSRPPATAAIVHEFTTQPAQIYFFQFLLYNSVNTHTYTHSSTNDNHKWCACMRSYVHMLLYKSMCGSSIEDRRNSHFEWHENTRITIEMCRMLFKPRRHATRQRMIWERMSERGLTVGNRVRTHRIWWIVESVWVNRMVLAAMTCKAMQGALGASYLDCGYSVRC